MFKVFEWKRKKHGCTAKAEKVYLTSLTSFNLSSYYSTYLLVFIIATTYAVICPFVSIICVVFFAISYAVMQNQFLLVYSPDYETGGLLFFPLYNYVLTGLNFSNATLAGYFIVKEGWVQFIVLLFVFPVIEACRHRGAAFYNTRCRALALDGAAWADSSNDALRDGSGDPSTKGFDRGLYAQPLVNLQEKANDGSDESALSPHTVEASLGGAV